MAKGLSLYLDLFRFSAALIVVIFHAASVQMGGEWFAFPFGPDAVIGFFILSGFVIASVVHRRQSDAVAFAAARLARLWSVLIPALLITPMVDAIGMSLSRAPYANWGHLLQFDAPILRLACAALFLNEVWFFSVPPLSNGPVWSIGFEAWYYALFGVWAFSSGRRRAILLGLVLLLIGPKILLLFPLWCLGWFLYERRHLFTLPAVPAFALLVLSPVAILLAQAAGAAEHLWAMLSGALGANFVSWGLNYAQHCLWFYVVGFFLALHFMGAIALSDHFERLLAPLERPVRLLAATTFPIYLFHHPMQLAVAAGLDTVTDGPWKTLVVVMASLCVSASLGLLCDRLRRPMRKAIERTLRERLAPPPTPPLPTAEGLMSRAN